MFMTSVKNTTNKGLTNKLTSNKINSLYIFETLVGEVVAGFTPLDLFQNGEQGVWYDPSDLTTLFQDDAGTTPVTADGDPVGLVLDKSQGGYGDELLTNGTFDSDISGWTSTGSTFVWETGGVVGRTTTGVEDIFYQTVTTVVGKVYKLEVNFISYTLDPDFYVDEAKAGTLETTGINTYFFTATSTSHNFGLRVVNADLEFDNFSVKEVKGNHATQSVSASRPTYRTDGTLHWLEFDGVDDYMNLVGLDYGTSAYIASIGAEPVTKSTTFVIGHSVGSNKIGRLNPSTMFARITDAGGNISTAAWDSISVVSFGDSDGGSTIFSRKDAVEDSSARTGGSSDWDLLGATSTSGQNFQGDLYALVMSSTYSAQRLSDIESFIAEKSGVTL